MICEGSPKDTFAVITQKCDKTANINVKKLQFIHKLTASDTSKTAKITKKVILLSSRLTFRRCAGGYYHFVVIFAVLDVSLAVNLCRSGALWRIGRVSKQIMIIYPRSTFTHDFPYFR